MTAVDAAVRGCLSCGTSFVPRSRGQEECRPCDGRYVQQCRLCGCADEARYTSRLRERLLAEDVCFRCVTSLLAWLTFVAGHSV